MADNVLESGPPSAKRPKLSSPALSVSASDGNGKYTFFHLYDLGKCLFSFNCHTVCFNTLLLEPL